jgi:hypothetical protein
MKKQPIDSLFADKLQQAEIAPRAEAWAKLQGKMAKKEKKIVWLPFVSWSAAASVVLLAGLGIWFMNSSDKPAGAELANVKTPTQKTVLVPQEKVQVADNQEIKTPKPTIATPKPSLKSDYHTAMASVNPQEIVVKNEKTATEPISKKAVIIEPEPKPETIAAIAPIQSQQKTVRLELSEPTIELLAANEAMQSELVNNTPKEKRINKIFRQLKNLKNGDDVNWKEVGVTSPKLLARLNRNQESEISNQK